MPMYDFKCPKCGHIKEDLVAYSDLGKVNIPCSKCKYPKMETMASAPIAKFRGSGFHATDYGKNGPKL